MARSMESSLPWFPRLLLTALLIPYVVSQTCYFPAGNVADGNVPCDPTAEVSVCCGSASSCLSNGLCLVNNDTDTVEFGRGGCTDQTFESPLCFQHCTSSEPGSPATNGAAIFECGTVGFEHQASYCCENGIDAKLACCSTPSLVFQLAAATSGAFTAVQTISSSAITTSKPTSTRITTTSSPTSSGSASSSSASQTSTGTTASSRVAAAATSTPTNPPVTSSSDLGVKIGVGVGIPVAVLLLALVSYLLWRQRRSDRQLKSLQATMGPSAGQPPNSLNPHEPMQVPPVPMKKAPGHMSTSGGYYKPSPHGGPMMYHELGTQQPPSELDGRRSGMGNELDGRGVERSYR